LSDRQGNWSIWRGISCSIRATASLL